MLPVVLLACLAADDPGFGGAPAPPSADFRASADAPVDEDPEQAGLRARLEAALKATPGESAEAKKKRSKLEEEVEKAKLDPTLPLLAFRIEVARAELEVEELTSTLQRPEVVRAAEERVAALKQVSDLAERIALARLLKCMRAIGMEVTIKNYRMTPGGPVMLSTTEMVDQLPLGDPPGCERIILVDAETMARVRRLFALRTELKARSFGYHEVAARKALEKEEAALAKDLEQQAIPATPIK